MKHKFWHALLTGAMVATMVFNLSACNLGGGSELKNDEPWSMERLYATAQELGFEGTLEELIAMFKGDKGDAGENGANGVDGKDGVGILSVRVNAEGELIITLTSGIEVNCGIVRGAQGEKGENGTDGNDGKDGQDGTDGKDGKSAFDIWKEVYGDEDSTEEDFLNWLRGGSCDCEHGDDDTDDNGGSEEDNDSTENQLTLKELRCHVNDYALTAVRVEGVVVATFDNTAYIEEYDAETGLCFGMPVYYGATASGSLRQILSVGNLVSVYGFVTEFNGTYQISGITSSIFGTRDTDTFLVSENNEPAFMETSAKDIISGKLDINFKTGDGEDGNEKFETISLDYGEAVMNTSVTLSNLRVISTYTTSAGSSMGAMSLTCVAEDGTQITVRTEVLTENGVLVTSDRYMGKIITVKGIVDKYNDSYQVKVWRADYITVL